MAVVKSNSKEKKTKIQYNEFPLAPANFIRMAIAGILIVVGFVLMAGGSNDSEVFNMDIFRTRRVIVGPAISFIGFVYMAFAIIYKSRKTKNNETEE